MNFNKETYNKLQVVYKTIVCNTLKQHSVKMIRTIWNDIWRFKEIEIQCIYNSIQCNTRPNCKNHIR